MLHYILPNYIAIKLEKQYFCKSRFPEYNCQAIPIAVCLVFL